MNLREITGGGKDAHQAKGKDPMPKAKGGRKKHPLKHQLVGDSIEHELDEAAPVIAAAIWLIKWAAVRGAWPVLKFILKRYGGKLAFGAGAVAAIDEGWDWVISKVGEEYAQMLIDNKFEIGMAVALIMGAVALQKIFMKKGDEIVAKYQESINEMTSAGGIAAVAMPMGTLQRRGTKPKRKAKKKNR